MRKNLLLCAILSGCISTPAPITPAAQRAAESGTLSREESPKEFVYILMPNDSFLEREYQFQVRQAQDIFFQDPTIVISDYRLQRWAKESAASIIAGTLHERYGDHITGDFLPVTGVLIIKADLELDLSILGGLID